MKFSRVKDLKNLVARQLVDKGVLTEETGTVLRIFRRTIFPEVDGGPEQDLRERKKRLEKLTSGQLAGKATKEAVQAVQAAIMVTTIMPAVFAAGS